MNRKAIIALLAALVLLLSAFALAEGTTLTVQGTGVVSLDPDTATITLGVHESSKDVSRAQAAVNERLAKVLEALRGMGVKDEDIHTSSLSIYEDFGYSRDDMRYAVQNNISVTLRDIDNVGQTIDAAFEAGANAFSDIWFSASDTEAAKARALELSIESARKKADVLAAAAGMEITGIESIAEQGGGMGVYTGANRYDIMAEKAEEDAGTQVFSEQIQVSATVTVVYTMAPVEG